MISLKNLAQATPQQVFDQCKAHLLEQNCKSLTDPNESGSCAYRGKNGLKCAAGCFIGDDEYVREMDIPNDEGTNWSSLIKKGLVPDYHSSLIRELQKVHDMHKPEDWPSELTRVAREFSLVES
jgi:hypothetical protein